MSNFYIAEILNLKSAAGLIQENKAELKDIKKIVLEHLKQKSTTNKAFQKPNVLWYNSELDSFKIDLARQIIKEAHYSDWNQESIRVLVLLNFASASLAAQNALLKLIEEPPANTQIILVVNNDHQLLPTISSRCSIRQSQFQPANNQIQQAENFNFPQNLTQAIELIEQYKDRETAIHLIKNLLEQGQLNYQEKRALSQAYIDLKANLNVRLALEHCFLTLFKKELLS